mmetsp:Transcript_32046/g.83004  ORF Transcript_32046/g.83004 Transcript_32046/m.83004 type:complete len:223 (+) Transcript_32046:1-669(+)
MRYMSRRPCWECCADGSPRHGLQWGVGDLAKRGPVFRHAAPRPFNALTDRAVWDVVARRPVCHVSAQCRSVTEHWQRARGQWCGVGRVASTQQLEEARARRHGDAHDDGLAHPHNVVHRAPDGGLKQVVCRLFKGGQHQHTVLHLGDAEPGDAQHLALVRHAVCEQHDVALVDGHAVAAHGVLDLRHDGEARGLDAQRLLRLHHVVGRRLRARDARHGHHTL